MIHLTVRALDKKERFLVLVVHRTLRGLLKTQYLSLGTCRLSISEHDTYVFIHSRLKIYNKRGNQIDLKVGPN